MRLRSALSAVLVCAVCAGAAPAAAADQVHLRNWYLGIQTVRGGHDEYDVFASPDLPPGEVETIGPGGGFVFGRRFGDRFLLGLQLVMTDHRVEDDESDLYVGEALITGTVLFNARAVVQPFLRGGVGGGMAVMKQQDQDGVASLGTAAVVAAGLQLRASSRVSFELEGAGTVTNFFEVNNDITGETWKVRTSHVGWRAGIGFYFWF